MRIRGVGVTHLSAYMHPTLRIRGDATNVMYGARATNKYIKDATGTEESRSTKA